LCIGKKKRKKERKTESGSGTGSDYYTLKMEVKVIIRWKCKELYNGTDSESAHELWDQQWWKRREQRSRRAKGKKLRFVFNTWLKLLAEDPVQSFGLMGEELVCKFMQTVCVVKSWFCKILCQIHSEIRWVWCCMHIHVWTD
jgi:hypothetical protein